MDTSTYSQLRRGHSIVLDWFARADMVMLSATVLGELEAGFQLGSRYRANLASLREFLEEPFVTVENVTPSIARRYGQLFSDLRKAGTPIPTNVIWIAAAALESGAHLVTFDSDFERISGLHHTLLSP